MRNFRELKVWEKAHHVTIEIYALSGNFPKGEQYGIVSQLRRASVSITANISEGCGHT